MHHCPLCIQPLPSLASNPALIFLDIDGVLSDRHSPYSDTDKKIIKTRLELFGKTEELTLVQYRIADAKHLVVEAVENLKRLIQTVEKTRPVAIILSSQWRNDGTLQQLREVIFKDHFFAPYIMGKTAPEKGDSWAPEIKKGYKFEALAKEKYHFKYFNRLEQIEHWLFEHNLSQANFLILDDDDFKFSQRYPNRFVRTQLYLSEENAALACKILKVFKIKSLPLGHAFL